MRRAFTLVELLVTIAIVAVLLGILAPALKTARDSAMTAKCLSNIRNMELAGLSYSLEHKGELIDVGLAHGGSSANEAGSFIVTLSDYYETPLLLRAPDDDSPHWPAEEDGAGVPVPPTENAFRRTSYGVNSYLTSLGYRPYRKIADITQPTTVVHFLRMAEEGEFAGSDHVHAENWNPGFGNPALRHAPPRLASQQVQTNAHGGVAESWDAISNYGFLDGHAETTAFRQVFVNREENRFDPGLQR